MGGYLSIAEAAAEPAKVSSLVLVNAALPMADRATFDRRVFAWFMGMALPGVGAALMRARARRGPERMVRDVLTLCCVDPSRVAPEVVEAHVALARERIGYGRVVAKDFLAAQRSLMARLFRRRRFERMVATVRAPALILQGDRDRLVQLASARALAALRTDWQLVVLEGIGHVPQLEAPERFLEAVLPWLRRRLAA
jgi:pimeloyl-ACP methyl ester carboxylesterase